MSSGCEYLTSVRLIAINNHNCIPNQIDFESKRHKYFFLTQFDALSFEFLMNCNSEKLLVQLTCQSLPEALLATVHIEF